MYIYQSFFHQLLDTLSCFHSFAIVNEHRIAGVFNAYWDLLDYMEVLFLVFMKNAHSGIPVSLKQFSFPSEEGVPLSPHINDNTLCVVITTVSASISGTS